MKLIVYLSLFFVLTGAGTTESQSVIKLYEGKPKGSENWTWSEQTSTKNQFNTEVVYNVSEPTLTAYLPARETAVSACANKTCRSIAGMSASGIGWFIMD